jgi:amidase
MTRAPATSSVGELGYLSASQAAEAIRSGQISSVELTSRAYERIKQFDPALNAFVYQLEEEALAQAKQCDEALARQEPMGVLHGVPFQIKESYALAGHPCTWGVTEFSGVPAQRNAEVVDRLLRAGGVLIGATNVPRDLADWQSYNSIYGTSNNPWDLGRTPGGSSGGSAAALAAGLGHFGVGSDIGGSIRLPSHFCGVYGHKPSLDLVSLRGHMPGGAQVPAGFSTLLAVAGPMARDARDLLAILNVIGGPEGYDAKAWQWKLPPPRHENLKEFRVGYVVDDPAAPVSPDVRAVLENVVETLGAAGAKMVPGWPDGFELSALMQTYAYMLFAFITSTSPPTALAENTQKYEKLAGPGKGEALASLPYWQAENLKRLGFRARWQAYFDEIDVFLSPVAFTPAFAHDHSEPQAERIIETAGGPRHYLDGFAWIGTATLTGCPATVAPAGLTDLGLPVGLQIMGPHWEDATSIKFAELLTDEIGGFVPPPGYGG